MQKIRWLTLLFGVVLLMAAMYQNSETATVKLFAFEAALPKYVLLFVSVALGFLLGAITTGRMLRRSARSKAAAEKSPGSPATKQSVKPTEEPSEPTSRSFETKSPTST